MNKKINLLQLNKGSANYENKLNDIDYITKKYKPDIMCISEANLKCSNQNVINHYKDYNIEFNKMSNNIDISHNILLVNNKLSYVRCLDLEDENTCTIWIEIKIPKCKSLTDVVFSGGGFNKISNENF